MKGLGLLENWTWGKGGGVKPGEVGGVRPLVHTQDSGSSLKTVGTY